MGQFQGVDSEVGQLKAVLVHRPGLELQRMTPRHTGRLLFGSLPWVSKARQEHDMLCEALRAEGVHVLYLTELLQDCLEYQAARSDAIQLAITDAALGDELRSQLRSHLEELGPEQLAQVLIAGLTPAELKIGHGVVFELLDRHDFVLDPLPNLMFTRDASFWVGDQIAIASLASGRRRREADLATVVYRHHPMFAGATWLYESDLEHVDGGDVLLLAPGVVAIGVGQRTAPAGAERLTRRLFERGLAHTVLAVPMTQTGEAGHLDTMCAILDADSVVMHPAVAYGLTAHTIVPRGDGLRMSRPQPFLEAAAQAMRIARLRVVDAGIDPLWGQPGQRDDGSNVLAIGNRVAVSHERNSETNGRLEAAGVRVIRVPSSELGSVRGGPRCMTCPVSRDPAVVAPEVVTDLDLRTGFSRPGPVELAGVRIPESRPASQPDVVGEPQAPVPAGVVADRDGSGLASARLQAAARPVARPAAEPKCTKPQADDRNDQRDHGQPDERPGDRQGYEHDNDRAHDHRQHSKHDSTLRPAIQAATRGSDASREQWGEIGYYVVSIPAKTPLTGPAATPI